VSGTASGRSIRQSNENPLAIVAGGGVKWAIRSPPRREIGKETLVVG
jgi:hypothetical protein